MDTSLNLPLRAAKAAATAWYSGYKNSTIKYVAARVKGDFKNPERRKIWLSVAVAVLNEVGKA